MGGTSLVFTLVAMGSWKLQARTPGAAVDALEA